MLILQKVIYLHLFWMDLKNIHVSYNAKNSIYLFSLFVVIFNIDLPGERGISKQL